MKTDMTTNMEADMKILVVGASGATGKLVVQQLLAEGKQVNIVVRSDAYLSAEMKDNPRLIITKASLLELTNKQLQNIVHGCTAVVSCLGHNLTLKGIYGQPRRLVTKAVQRLCKAVETVNDGSLQQPIKFILMNSTGNQNSKDGETVPFSQAITVNIIRCLLPPHADNEQAARYLQAQYGKNHPLIEWVAVRPDALVDKSLMTPYDIYEAPIRNPIFDAGKTSRINVAHFMAQLISEAEIWNKWKTTMPVIYNRSEV